MLGPDGRNLFQADSVVSYIQRWTTSFGNSVPHTEEEGEEEISAELVRPFDKSEISSVPMRQEDTIRERRNKIVDTIDNVVLGSCSLPDDTVLEMNTADPIDDALVKVRYRPLLSKMSHWQKHWVDRFVDYEQPVRDRIDVPSKLLDPVINTFHRSMEVTQRELEEEQRMEIVAARERSASVGRRSATPSRSSYSTPRPAMATVPVVNPAVYVSLLDDEDTTADVFAEPVTPKVKRTRGAPRKEKPEKLPPVFGPKNKRGRKKEVEESMGKSRPSNGLLRDAFVKEDEDGIGRLRGRKVAVNKKNKDTKQPTVPRLGRPPKKESEKKEKKKKEKKVVRLQKPIPAAFVKKESKSKRVKETDKQRKERLEADAMYRELMGLRPLRGKK